MPESIASTTAVALEVAAVAASCTTVTHVAHELLPALAQACEADLAVFHQIDLTGNPQEYGVHWPVDADVLNALSGYTAHMETSPLVRHFATTGRTGVASLGRLVTRLEWRAHPIYVDGFRSLGIDDHLAAVVRLVDGRGLAFTLARPHRSFTPREHHLVELLTPHLRHAAQRALASTEPYVALRTLPVPEVTTVFGPAVLDVRHPSLTRRQVEVLALVAAGLGNRQISRQLAVAPRTVDKHLEDICRRLGTTSRTASVAAWSAAARGGPPIGAAPLSAASGGR